MTTRKPIEGVTKDDTRKPAIFKLYDFTKTGTDSMDSRLEGFEFWFMIMDDG